MVVAAGRGAARVSCTSRANRPGFERSLPRYDWLSTFVPRLAAGGVGVGAVAEAQADRPKTLLAESGYVTAAREQQAAVAGVVARRVFELARVLLVRVAVIYAVRPRELSVVVRTGCPWGSAAPRQALESLQIEHQRKSPAGIYRSSA